MARTVFILHLTDDDRDALYSMRELVRDLETYKGKLEDAKERMPGGSSPRFDGMPGGSVNGDAILGNMIAVEELERKVSGLERKYNTVKPRCIRALDKLPPELYDFALHYFLQGLSFDVVCAVMDRSKKSCERYKARIDGKTKKEP